MTKEKRVIIPAISLILAILRYDGNLDIWNIGGAIRDKSERLEGNNPIVSMLGHLWGIHRAGWDDAELYRSNPG